MFSIPIAVVLASLAQPTQPLQNVVVVVMDDVGVNLVGAYESFYPGHPDPNYPNHTPVIDSLAQSGILFRNAWTNPVCSPTRAQILTGRHGLHTGIGSIARSGCPPIHLNNSGVVDKIGWGLDPAIPILPTYLRRSAAAPVPYHTAAVGKWHLADGCQFPGAAGDPPIPIHPLGLAIPWFHQYAGSMFNLADESYNLWTKTFATRIRGNDECDPSGNPIYCQAIVTDYATQDTIDDAVHLVRTMPEPFFLYVAFNAAHEPLDTPAGPLPAPTCLGGPPVGTSPCWPAGTQVVDPAARTRCLVEILDQQLGRLLCAIDDGPNKPEIDTTIIVLGDNGTTNDATVPPFPDKHNKGTVYQGGVNVPFLIRSPLTPASAIGSVNDALVCSTDILATVADLAGVTLDPDPLRESVSMLPYILGTTGSIREFVYAEKFDFNFTPDANGQPPADYTLDKHERAIRNVAGLKLIQSVTKGGGGMGGVLKNFSHELFDLNSDPFEQNDIFNKDDPTHAALRNQLDTAYPHLVR